MCEEFFIQRQDYASLYRVVALCLFQETPYKIPTTAGTEPVDLAVKHTILTEAFSWSSSVQSDKYFASASLGNDRFL
jgi:hypothetical protein